MENSPQPPTGPPRTLARISPAELARIQDLYDRGFMLQAYNAAKPHGPLDRWAGTPARVLACRMAGNLGAQRLASRLSLWTHFRDPGDGEARFYYVLVLLERRGPLAAWRALESFGDLADAPASIQADLLALRCRTAALLRDFETAEQFLRRAESAAPERAWIHMERSFLLQQQDLYEEARAAARDALQAHQYPFYRPAVQAAAHLLELLDRDDEALELLTQANAAIESGPVAGQLSTLEAELGLNGQAIEHLDRFVELSPLLEPDGVQWATGQRAKLLALAGRLEEAVAVARTLDDPFHQRFAQALTEPGMVHRRVVLPVQFVRQHHKTCVPATLAALGRFWGMSSDHLQVAEAICYDGTPGVKQRAWAESNGWVVREFRLTWESAVALLDRGVPFTVGTVETGSAHMQALIGYDSLRRSFWIRDPSQRHAGEVLAEPFLERYRSTGPKAMALVPVQNATLLEGLDLPDAALHDQIYELQRALEGHERERAQAAVEALKTSALEHPLCWQARRDLAEYDGNRAEQLVCLEGLLRLFPGDANLQLAKLGALHDARREERLSFLESIRAEKLVDPIFWRAFACELSVDARARPAAERFLNRSLRFRPLDAASFTILANLLWGGRQFAQALELYRFAACLEDKREQCARTYFIAARHLRQTERALAQLQSRFQNLSKFAAGPTTTLVWALQALHRTPEAFDCLESALKLRADDGALLCFAADEHARWGKMNRAQALLALADGKCHRSQWLRTAAQAAQYRGEPAQSLELWRQLLELEPLAMDVQREAAGLIAAVEGRPAALGHLEQMCRRFPNHFGLHQLWIEWMRAEPAAAAEPVIRRLLLINPADAWGLRELACCLSREKQFEEALLHANRALEIEPENPAGYNTRAAIYVEAGERRAASADLTRAIELAVDNDYAIRKLVELSETHPTRLATLQFVEQELIRQVVFGDGLLAFRAVAHPVLRPEQLLKSLRFALMERPDLWHAWAAVVQQLTDMGHLDEALRHAQDATERFPLLPRLWFELARVNLARGNRPEERAALEKALEISPGWNYATRRLAEVMEYEGNLARAREILEQAVARDPLDEFNQGYLADMLWKLGERERALERLQRALQINSSYDWAWGALSAWANEIGQPELAVSVARTLTTQRAGEANSWFRLARVLSGRDALQERLDSLEHALRLQPQLISAHTLRAEILAQAGRYDEASALCAPERWGGSVPVQLRATEASIQAARGHLPEAMRLIRAALEAHPDFYPGWNNLAGWAFRQGKLEEAAEAATQMARLAPLQAVPLATLGDLKVRRERPDEAMDHYRRALELDPEYAYAGFSVLINLGQEEEAVSWLNSWPRHPKVEMWMLYNLVLSLRNRREESRADSALQHALRLLVRDHSFPALCAWAGFEGAVKGEVAAAEAALANLEQLQLSGEQQVTVAFTRAMVALQRAPAADRTPVCRASVMAAKAAFNDKPAVQTSMMRRMLRRALQRMAQDAPGVWVSWQRVLLHQNDLAIGVVGVILALLFIIAIGSGISFSPLIPVWIGLVLWRSRRS